MNPETQPFGTDPKYDEQLKKNMAEAFNPSSADSAAEITKSKSHADTLEDLMRKVSRLEAVSKMTVESGLAADIQSVAEVYKFLKDPDLAEKEKVKLFESNMQFAAAKQRLEKYIGEEGGTAEVVSVSAAAAEEKPKFKSAAEIAMERADAMMKEPEQEKVPVAEVVEAQPLEDVRPRLRTAAEIAMEKADAMMKEEESAEIKAASPIEERGPRLRTAAEIAMERADKILKEAQEAVGDKSEQKSVVENANKEADVIKNKTGEKETVGGTGLGAAKEQEKPAAVASEAPDALRVRLENLKQINLEEGLFRSIGTERERASALREMIAEAEKDIEKAEAEKKSAAEIEALRAEKKARLDELQTHENTAAQLEEALEASKGKVKEAKVEVKKVNKKIGFWRRLFGGL